MSLPAVRAAADLQHRPRGSMMMCSTDEIPGFRIVRTLGLVRGNTVRARNVGVDIIAGLKALVGGEIGDYTKMLAESREQSIDRMRAEALALGANAIVAVRFTTSTVMQGAAEMLVYGTAVVGEPLDL
ncbi:YbjQ family protein [Paraliomyxa miuraensis]|uniref:YbjQ family protein n=1 Tax=Paraliomyxa miuraensis TaxID=376150 RepID=UPI00225983B0|nr:YbjQ family protein [Paraliomyxa miuraensis]MCX4246215.1 YbjQ family protein [Paraliomyxa miuraensis]